MLRTTETSCTLWKRSLVLLVTCLLHLPVFIATYIGSEHISTDALGSKLPPPLFLLSVTYIFSITFFIIPSLFSLFIVFTSIHVYPYILIVATAVIIYHPRVGLTRCGAPCYSLLKLHCVVVSTWTVVSRYLI